MPEVDEMFEEVSDELVARRGGVERGRILHSVGVKTGGKFFAFVAKGDLVVKLPRDRVAELIANGTGRVFDAGKGRPMKEWVRLSPGDKTVCAAYAEEARSFVAGQRADRKG
jgi:TfoX/Sxy family transcriptional regulator of competence genes